MSSAGHFVTSPRHWLCMAALLGASAATAQMPTAITPGELARLPVYCPYTISWMGGSRERAHGGGPRPEQLPWLGKMGEGFWAVHHYCWALVNANRARYPGTAPSTRLHLYSRAIDDVRYVLTNSQPDFPLRPELHLRAGEYLLELDKKAQAAEELERAIQLKPDYWPAHVRLAELYVGADMWPRAREVVARGLSVLPDEPQLKALAARLAQRGLPVIQKQPLPLVDGAAAGAASAASSPSATPLRTRVNGAGPRP
jgi:hypothetical protein